MLQNVTPHKYVCAGRPGWEGAAFGAGGRAAAPQLLTRARGGGCDGFGAVAAAQVLRRSGLAASALLRPQARSARPSRTAEWGLCAAQP